MWRSKFFWKLYLTYTSLVLLTTAIIGVLVHGQMKKALIEDIETSLKHKLTLFASHFDTEDYPEHKVYQLKEESLRVGVRLSVLRTTGDVLFDSHRDAQELENHASRPEVAASFQHGFGKSSRYSQSTQQWMLYMAQRVGPKSDQVVRLSIPLSSVEARLSKMRGALIIGAAFGFLVALIMGWLVAKRITTPIQEMTDVAQSMRQGHYSRRFREKSDDEIGILGTTFNALGEELEDRIRSLSEEELRMRTILKSMTEGVIAIDESNQVLFSNLAAREILGDSELGNPGISLWRRVEIHKIRKIVELARRAKKRVRKEVELNFGGREKRIYCVAKAIDTEGTKGVVLVLEDTTELKRLEAIRKDFVANVSHELKTPLTSIKGYVETLLSGAIHDEKNNRRFLSKIETHVDQLGDLVQDLLSLARIEGPDRELPTQTINLNSFVESNMASHEMAAQKAGLSLSVEFAESPVYVVADPKALRQVLDNLVDNAIKYTKQGSIAVSVERENNFGTLLVKDTGFGIPKNDLPRVFERFYRIDKSHSRTIRGTGLGLSIVKHLVNSMMGNVSVRSKQGEGSCFKVELKLAEPGAVDERLHASIDRASRRKKKGLDAQQPLS